MSHFQTLFQELQPLVQSRPHTLTVAYLANQFPSPVEPYVGEEIEELRSRGVHVIPGSVRGSSADTASELTPEVALQPLRFLALLQAGWLCIRHLPRISGLGKRIIFSGSESPTRRVKALMHTWLGAYHAVLLKKYGVDHIHVHHGYFGSWIAMVAAKLLRIDFSMTLHGSDLLLHGVYLDAKLESCRFCLTVSEYNRSYILEHYPTIDPERVLVSRLGVDLDHRFHSSMYSRMAAPSDNAILNLLSVGRLHPIKDHAFLLRACAQLRARGINFECSIAGEGRERRNLESLICKYGLEDRVTLLGHVPREQMNSLYERADVVLLTSRSEGIPVTLMEAMGRGKIVLAPAITGIPELVIMGRTGFVYEPGSLGDFVGRLLFIDSLRIDAFQPRRSRGLFPHLLSAARPLDWVRHGARVQIAHGFNRRKNLEYFADSFLQRIRTHDSRAEERSPTHADLILQQI
jgi:colanic acid/amylovoran biosynthesis glycosyltransferase